MILWTNKMVHVKYYKLIQCWVGLGKYEQEEWTAYNLTWYVSDYDTLAK